MTTAVTAPNNATFARSLVLGMPGYTLPPPGRFLAELRSTTDPTQAEFAQIALRFDSQVGSIGVTAYDGVEQTATVALLASAQDMAQLSSAETYTADLVYIQGNDVANFGQFVFTITQGLTLAPLPAAPSYGALASWGPIVDIAGASAPTVLAIESQGLPGPAAWSATTAWAATTQYQAYPPASVVTYGDDTYVCSTSHTSTSTFDPTKWTLLPALSATQAAASAAAALASQEAGAASQAGAAGSATAALASQEAAAVSQGAAAASAATATTQATSATGAAAAMAALLASFRGVFLGPFASDTAATTFATAQSITLAAGVMYENTTEDKFRTYSGTAWGDYDASAQASQSAAALSAGNAGASAATATTQAGIATGAATASAASLAAFRAVFLGPFATDAAANSFASANTITLVAGQVYSNTTEGKFRTYSGTAWADYDATAQAAAAAAAVSEAAAAASAASIAGGPVASVAGLTGIVGAGALNAALGAVNPVLLSSRAPVADANYAVAAGIGTVAFTSITAARVVTLPVASSYAAGQRLLIVDESGACSATNTITAARAGSDTINGAASAVLATARAYVTLESNGVTAWTIVNQSTLSMAQQAASAVAITGGTAVLTAPAQGDASGRAITSAWFGQNLPGALLNKARNAGANIAQRGASGSVSAGAAAYTLDGWIVTATGAAAAWSQQWNANIRGNVLRLSAASGLTDATIVHRIESYPAAQLLTAAKTAQPVTMQWTIYNNSGAAITPKVFSSYFNARDVSAAQTNDLASTPAQTIANGAEGVVAYTFVPNVNIANGYSVGIDFGAALNGSSGSIDVTNIDVRATPGVATGVNNNPPPPELLPPALDLLVSQRYLPAYRDDGSGSTFLCLGNTFSTTGYLTLFGFSVPTRVAPTGITISAATTFAVGGPIGQTPSAPSFHGASSPYLGGIVWTLSTTTAGLAASFESQTTGALILFTGAEL